MTCQSFTSVSLDPPLVAFLPTKQSRAFAAIQRAGTFCVNFLGAGQVELSNQFASRGDDKFAGRRLVAQRRHRLAAARRGSSATSTAPSHAVHEAGDHFLVIGKVVDLAVGDADDRFSTTAGATAPDRAA